MFIPDPDPIFLPIPDPGVKKAIPDKQLVIVVVFLLQGLDMTPYVIQPGHGQAVYDLVAVSNHYGGMGGGHCKYPTYFLFIRDTVIKRGGGGKLE